MYCSLSTKKRTSVTSCCSERKEDSEWKREDAMSSVWLVNDSNSLIRLLLTLSPQPHFNRLSTLLAGESLPPNERPSDDDFSVSDEQI